MDPLNARRSLSRLAHANSEICFKYPAWKPSWEDGVHPFSPKLSRCRLPRNPQREWQTKVSCEHRWLPRGADQLGAVVADGSLLWLVQDGSASRRMFHYVDGYKTLLEPNSEPINSSAWDSPPLARSGILGLGGQL